MTKAFSHARRYHSTNKPVRARPAERDMQFRRWNGKRKTDKKYAKDTDAEETTVTIMPEPLRSGAAIGAVESAANAVRPVANNATAFKESRAVRFMILD